MDHLELEVERGERVLFLNPVSDKDHKLLSNYDLAKINNMKF